MHRIRILFQIPQPGQGQLPWMLYRLRDIRVGSYRAAPAATNLGELVVRSKLIADSGELIGEFLQIVDGSV
ncbi:hypothetical protein DFR46_0339 [Parasphingopyxis lamellibrachiae]|uniref:Uncharacterized protein n=1 Tax=Parasphingopyxis lamellibrachiae TaxID=680125 RepID=A0A3D9FCF4_9SPHN|nr:hypothetical protein DFR46_0339 [Parasphingopyxis lamellibrachiae]